MKAAAKSRKAAQKYGAAGPAGADQVLTAVYDASSKTLRVEGAGGGSGTVTSVGLSLPSTFSVAGSPVTTSGTLSVSWAQPVAVANGGTGQTTASAAFNALAPATAQGGLIVGSGTNAYGNLALGASGDVLGSNGTTALWDTPATLSIPTQTGTITTGDCVKWASGTAITDAGAACGSGGTVTSVALAAPSSLLSVSGSPITASGTLTLSLANAAADSWFGNATGSSAAPSFNTSALPASLIPSPAGDVTGTYAATTVTGLHFGSTGLSLGTAPTSGQCLEYNGANVTGAACSGGSGLPSSWSVNGTTNAVTAQIIAGQNAVPLTVQCVSGQTADCLDVKDSSGSIAFGVTANDSLNFIASNLQLASSTGATPYLYLIGTNSIPGQPYLKISSAALSVPTAPTVTVVSGGSLTVGDVVTAEETYTNSAGETTVGSATTSAAATTGNQSVTISAPAANVSATSWNYYANQCASPGPCTGLTKQGSNSTFSGTVTLSSITSGVAPPSSNTTGAAFIDAWQSSGEGVGLCLASSASSSDCAVGSAVHLVGGMALSLTPGATTTANALACFSGSETVSQCAANAANDVVGVFVGGQQNSLVQTTGVATINLASAGTTTYNHFACTNTTAGTIVDSASACASGQQVGLIAQTNASNVTFVPVLLTLSGAGGGTCSNCVVTNPSAGQTITQSADQPTLFNINSALTSDTNSQWGVEVQGTEVFGLRRYCASCGIALYVDPAYHFYLGGSGEIDSQYGLILTQGTGYSITTNNNTLDDASGDMVALGGLGTFVTNASTTGTTLNNLAKLTGVPSKAVIAATTDTSGIIGVVVAGAGTTGNATIAQSGTAACAFDGATTAGDYVQISSTTGGDCHDAGATRPAANEIIGRILSTNAAAGSYNVLVELQNE